jgi:hypothetical protein
MTTLGGTTRFDVVREDGSDLIPEEETRNGAYEPGCTKPDS